MSATDRFRDFLSEGIVGFAGLAFLLIAVLPLLPFIAIGWVFNRAVAAAESRRRSA